MSFLDEESRAVGAAPTLLALLEQPARFPELFREYQDRDGLIDGSFLDRLALARDVWERAVDPQSAAEILALPLAFREAVLCGLRRDGRAATLAACLAANPARDLKKRLKRALYELEREGVAPPKQQEKKPLFAHGRFGQSESLSSYVSLVDAANVRAIVLNETVAHGVRVIHVVERGGAEIIDFGDSETSRKRARTMIDETLALDAEALLAVKPGFAKFLLTKLRQRVEAAGRALPAGYVTMMTQLELATDAAPPHPYRGVVDGQAALARLADLSDSIALHRELEFRSFVMDEETWRSLLLSLQDLESSALTINAEQQKAQAEFRLERAVDQFFQPARREAYADRLRDAAYQLADRGAARAAETAAALALALEDPQRAPGSIPFFRGMLLRLFPPEPPKPETPPSPGGLIL